MKEDINLLAPHVKRQRMYRLYLDRVGRLLNVVLLGCALLLLSYGGVYWVIRDATDTLSQQRAMANTGQADVSERVDEVNTFIRHVHARATEDILWTELLTDVFDVLPEEVVLTRMEVRVNPPALSLSGMADSRSSIVELQSDLEHLGWVRSIEAPLRNFTSGDDVTFTFTLFHVDGEKEEV